MLMLFPAMIFAQMKVSGIVTDGTTNEPLPGVNIQVVGTTQGTTSDFDGKYILDNVKNGSELEFSFIGYETQKIAVTSSNVNVVMKEDAQALDEVVIIGYGSTTKKDATGSVASISEKDFNEGSIVTPAGLITGRVAGVNITTDGSPGGGSAIRIRGGSSLDASNDPLIVVDGLPISNSTTGGARSILSSINPNDIESFSVLKDASATAIYGSRASNGVIIITTKKGKSTFQASYDLKVGFETLANQIEVFSADKFRTLIAEREALGQSGNDSSLLGNANTDWQKEIFQNVMTLENNFSVSGSVKDKLPARLSLGYADVPGLIKTSNFGRGNIGLALNPKFFKDHLQVNLKANTNFEKNRFEPGGVLGTALIMDPTQPVYDATSPFGGFFEYQSSGSPEGGPRNPVANIHQFENRTNVLRSYGNIEFNYKLHFLPEMNLVLNLGLDHSKGKGTQLRSKESIQGFRANNSSPFLGGESSFTSERNNKLLDTYFNYKKELNKLGFELTGGYSYQSFISEGYSSGNLVDPNHEDDISIDPELRLIGFFGRTNITFNDKYLLTLSYRRDGTSRFSSENRWGNFPAAAFAWNMSDENFLKDSKAINNLKLRLGWGITGQQDIPASYAYLNRIVTGNNVSQYLFGGTPYIVPLPQVISNNLKWEETTTYNAGLDYGLFDDKLSGSLDVYMKESRDLLSNAPIPDGSNFSNYMYQNIGKFISKGIEFSIGTDLFKKENFVWDVNYNINLNQTKIDELAYDAPIRHNGVGIKTGDEISLHQEGFAPSSFWVYKQLYNEAGNPIEGAFVDRNRDGIINDSDRYIYQKPAADITMGLQSNINVGKLDVSFALRASLGNYVYNSIAAKSVYSRMKEQTALANITTNVLNTNFESVENLSYLSDYYVENASFLKFDNFTMGYTFEELKVNLESIRLWGGVQNVYTLTKYSGLDPEVFGGVDNTIYPRPRTFMFGANVKF